VTDEEYGTDLGPDDESNAVQELHELAPEDQEEHEDPAVAHPVGEEDDSNVDLHEED
jgi:hypothetical protein